MSALVKEYIYIYAYVYINIHKIHMLQQCCMHVRQTYHRKYYILRNYHSTRQYIGYSIPPLGCSRGDSVPIKVWASQLNPASFLGARRGYTYRSTMIDWDSCGGKTSHCKQRKKETNGKHQAITVATSKFTRGTDTLTHMQTNMWGEKDPNTC